MELEEVAPPTESWAQHLKGLHDKQLAELACDYRWLVEESRPQEERGEFQQRREAIIAECERRGLAEAARQCRPPAAGSGYRAQ